MASFLSKLFKPKWQHASPEVRMKALAELDAVNDEDQQIILSLIKDDTSTDVRLAAMKQLGDPAKLVKLYPSIRQEDQSAALQLLNTQSKQLGLSLFDIIEDDLLLAEIILTSESQIDFMNGLARLQDENALFTIASKAQLSRVRQAATELVETEEHLQKLVDIARSKDKKVFHIAKSKIATIRDRQKQREAQQEQLATVLNNLEELARTEDINLYQAKLESLKQRWAGLEPIATEAQVSQYLSSLEICADKAKSLAKTVANDQTSDNSESDSSDAQGASSTQRSDAQEENEISATLLTLSDTLEQLRTRPASAQEISAIDAIIKTQETRWIESSKHTNIEKSQGKQYKADMSLMRQYLSALQRLNQQQGILEQLVNDTSEDALQRLSILVQKIAWPEGFEQPTPLASAMQQVNKSALNKEAESARQQELEDQYQSAIVDLDRLLDDKQLDASKKQMSRVRKLYDALHKRKQNQLAASFKLRNAQLNELRDWRGFVTSPQQIKLCELMEQLAEQHLDPQEKASKIKSLQQEWRALGGAQDQTLWVRFSTAADKAFEPCAEFFSEQGQLKQNNLEKRATLLSELSDFVAQNNWEAADWKAIEKINRQARQEWRDSYPIDHKKGRNLQQKFNAVLAKLDQHLDTERNRNLELKKNIVERAKELAENEDLKVAMNGAKELQKEWQNVGITDHKKDRALWKAFRVACDAIFKQRDKERDEAKAAVSEQKQKVEQALSDATKLANSDFASLDEAQSALEVIRQQTKQANELPAKLRGRMLDRYTELTNEIKLKMKALNYQHVIQQWQEAARKATIAQNAMEQHDPQALAQEFATSNMLLDKPLSSRFEALWQLLEKRGATVRDAQQAQELCIRCEIAAGIDSPDSDQERRMQLQVSRLSEGLSGAALQTREEQLHNLLCEWYAGACTASDLRAQYQSRINQCIEAVFNPEFRSKKLENEIETA